MNTLKIVNLSKTYANGVTALKGINLTLNNGMFGLLGPNGAGKSTLMRTIATLQAPSSGTVHFNSVNIEDSPEEMRKDLGYLPQEFGVYPKVSAWHLLDHIAVLKGILSKKERKEQIGTLLQQTNLFNHRNKYVSAYSGGMRQRFGIAQALLGNPKIIIVDEPTAGLDPEERYRFQNLLSEIGEERIIFLSTHIVEDVKDLCPDMAIIGDGELLERGAPAQLIEKLRGNVWRKTINPSQLPHCRSSFRVLSSRMYTGNILLHVLAEEKPGEDFEPVSPRLEDVYFSTLFNHQHQFS